MRRPRRPDRPGPRLAARVGVGGRKEDAMALRSIQSLRSIPAASVALCWVVAAGVASAQTATSTLGGIVSDASGSAVDGASVQVRNTATGAARRAMTDSAGRYSFANLPPGEYDLKVDKQGFAT